MVEHITKENHDLDDIQDGTTYGRVKLVDLTNGRIDLDKIQDGTTFVKTNNNFTDGLKTKLEDSRQ